MADLLDELTKQILKLDASERDELLRRVIVGIDGEPEDTPEAIARAWDEEIARRIDDLDAGRTKGIPAEEVFAEIRARITGHGGR